MLIRHHFLLISCIIAASFPSVLSDEVCQTTEDCPDFHSCQENICVHKDLFPLTLFPGVVCIIMMTIIGGILNTGGSGGGAVLSSLLIITFNYGSKDAIALVYSLLFGGNLGNFVNIAKRRDKKTGKPIINYDIVLMCSPSMLFGATLGVVLNRAAASALILAGTVCVLGYPLKGILTRARNLYAEETIKIKALKVGPTVSIDQSDSNQNTSLNSSILPDSVPTTMPATVQPFEVENLIPIKVIHPLFPPVKIAILLLLLISMMILVLFRGTASTTSIIGVTYCSLGYWALFGGSLLVSLAFLTLSKKYIKYVNKPSEAAEKHLSDVNELTSRQMMKLSGVSLLAGLLAGLLGIGGGIVLSPALLKLKVRPQVVTATSGFFIMQTSMISLFQSSLYGDVPLSNRMFFIGTSFVGSYSISLLFSWIIKKTKRDSILLFTLFTVISICIIVVPIVELWRNYGRYSEMIKFGSIC